MPITVSPITWIFVTSALTSNLNSSSEIVSRSSSQIMEPCPGSSIDTNLYPLGKWATHESPIPRSISQIIDVSNIVTKLPTIQMPMATAGEMAARNTLRFLLRFPPSTYAISPPMTPNTHARRRAKPKIKRILTNSIIDYKGYLIDMAKVAIYFAKHSFSLRFR